MWTYAHNDVHEASWAEQPLFGEKSLILIVVSWIWVTCNCWGTDLIPITFNVSLRFDKRAKSTDGMMQSFKKQ